MTVLLEYLDLSSIKTRIYTLLSYIFMSVGRISSPSGSSTTLYYGFTVYQLVKVYSAAALRFDT